MKTTYDVLRGKLIGDLHWAVRLISRIQFSGMPDEHNRTAEQLQTDRHQLVKIKFPFWLTVEQMEAIHAVLTDGINFPPLFSAYCAAIRGGLQPIEHPYNPVFKLLFDNLGK